nr:prepilin-type N-terminal cleavage/methylation domain-containing protein [uncultured Desulfobulbus sp.]
MERTRDNMAGFTLLELLLVVTILSAVAWMSLGVVTNNTDQLHFEDTKNRLQAIRRAIIGDTSRTVNGGPEVRGYVADMGRLPAKLQALVAQNYCDGLPQYSNSTDCGTAGGTWIIQTGSAYDSTTGLWAGWNGPYLPPGFGSTGTYLDGWGNNWNYSVSASGDLTVQSYGRDGASGGSDFDADYPDSTTPLITANEYSLNFTKLEVVFDFKSSSQCYVCQVSSGGYSNISDKNSCVSSGFTWKSLQDSSGASGCASYLGEDVNGDSVINQSDIIWQPSVNVCLAVSYNKNGIFFKDSTNLPYITTASKTISYNGDRATVWFDFATSSVFYLGAAAFAIVEADSGGNCPITQFTSANSFPTGAPLWTPFTYVPGTALQPFERKITSY